jgi:hypothetical protein
MNAAPSTITIRTKQTPGWRRFVQAIFPVYLIMEMALPALRMRLKKASQAESFSPEQA